MHDEQGALSHATEKIEDVEMTRNTELDEHSATETSEVSAAATEHIAVEAEGSVYMDDIGTGLSALSTDDERYVVNAVRIILKERQAANHNLCRLVWRCFQQFAYPRLRNTLHAQVSFFFVPE